MTDYLENLEQQEEIFPSPEETPMVEQTGEDAPIEQEKEETPTVEQEQEDASGEPEEKVKRRTRRRKAETTEEETPVEPHSAEPEGIDTIPPEKETSVPQEAEQEGPVEPEEADAPRRSRRAVTLDNYGNVIREPSDSGLRDVSVLTAARNARRILTATIDAIETDGDAMPRAVFYVGSVKVVIPFAQMGFDLDRGEGSQREARLFMGSMLGAKIDYMVRGIDTKARIAAASRRDAMLVRQASILNARGTSREYRVTEGMRVTARIVHVSRFTVRVEVYGFETFVPINRISNLWVNDIREVIQVGEERPVEILSLVRGEDGRVTKMEVSLRAAEEAPQLQLREGNTYTGHIINFSEKAYYVRISGMPAEIRCPVRSSHTMEAMGIRDLVKFYIRGVHDGVPTGAILKVLKKKAAPEF